jgi:hypothetical protein
VFNPEVIKWGDKKRVTFVKAQRDIKRPWAEVQAEWAVQVNHAGRNSSQSLILKFCESHRLSGTVWKLSRVWAGRRKTQGIETDECFLACH